uniref:Uncharacterized protein n=1 Tax=Arundo donax TaxID=35708 RepID=A0A0A9CCY3_ARUDO
MSKLQHFHIMEYCLHAIFVPWLHEQEIFISIKHTLIFL